MNNWENKKFCLATTTAISKVGDQAILLDTISGSYFQLNNVGKFITEHLQTKKDLKFLVGKIIENFNITDDRCHRDLIAFLDNLEKADLLVIEDLNE